MINFVVNNFKTMENYFYVARDSNDFIYLYRSKPYKLMTHWKSDSDYMMLDNNLFPNVKWEDKEPLPVIIQQAVFKTKENGQ